MATQVKFYSVGTLPATASTTGKGGIYFVGGPKDGELYRGTTRFGAGRVTEVADTTAMDAIADAIRGDIAVCAKGGAFAYNGTKWVAIGPDLEAVRESWLADISASLQALDVSFKGSVDTASVITGIKQVNGKIVAEASAFPQLTVGDKDGQIKLNGVNASVKGWESLVADKDDLEARVSAIETIVDADASTVTAETGIFKNLTVSDTATFNATVVSATTLTVDTEAGATFGGKTISAIADREAAAKIAALGGFASATGANVVTVSVTTQAGEVKTVEVGVQKATAIGSADDASNDKLATEKAVRDALNSLDNAMHFTGVVTALPEGTAEKPLAAGDIVVIGPAEEGSTLPEGLVEGQEYIYDGEKWELIGDQNTYAKNAYSKAGSEVMTGVTTVPTALDALADAVDTLNGADTVDGSVAKDIKEAVEALDATQDSNVEEDNADYVDNKSIKVTLTEENGKITGLGADLLWLGADGNVLV